MVLCKRKPKILVENTQPGEIGRIVAVSTFRLNHAFVNHAQRSGITFSKTEVDDNMQMSHGGHPNCRALIDKLYVRNLNSCLSTLQQGEVLVDLGSKYKMISKILTRATPIDPASMYHYNPQDPTHLLQPGMTFRISKDYFPIEV